MNGYITKYEPSGFQLEIMCDDTKIKEYTLEIISKFECRFTFNQICESLSYILNQENIFKKEPNTKYEGDLLINYKVRMMLMQYIWELIWEKKLMIDLYTPKHSLSAKNIYLLKTDTFDNSLLK